MPLARITALLAASLLMAPAAAQVANPPRSDHDAVASRFRAGQEAMRARRFPEAEAEYREVLALVPGLSEARANLGLVLFLQGEYAGSVAELERVIRERPDLSTAHLFLGLGHLKLGAPGKAIPPLEFSLEASPGNLEARRALAACHLAKADYASAVREFQAAFAHSRDKPEAWFLLGRDYMSLMRELAGSLVVGEPDSVWAVRLGADMLGLSQAWDAAARYYETAVGKRPDLPGLHQSLGRARLMLGDLDAAEEQFRAELRADPHAERAWLGLAEVNLARGDGAAALENVDEVWKTFPHWLAHAPGFPARPIAGESALELIAGLSRADGGPSRFLQAVLFAQSGDEGRARLQRSLFEKELEGVPVRAPGAQRADELCRAHAYAACATEMESRPSLPRGDLLLLGRAYLALGREERAVIAFTHAMRGADNPPPEAVYWTVRTLQSLADEAFRRVEELAPGSWRAHQLRAEAHRQRQADDEALAEYGRAIALKPDAAELHRSVGLIHLLNSDYDAAQRSLERALALDGANPRTLYLAGRLYVARQQHAESIRFLEAALRLDPNLVEARPTLGRAYLRVGRYREAATELQRGLDLDYYGDIHYSLFQAYRQLGRLDAAKQALDRSVAMRKSSFARDRSKFDRWIKSE